MACGALRQLCDGLNMSAILRPLYTICTCCVMQVCELNTGNTHFQTSCTICYLQQKMMYVFAASHRCYVDLGMRLCCRAS